MTQRERLIFLIRYLMLECVEYSGIRIPNSEEEQKKLLRTLMNLRPPRPIAEEFITVQDEYLTEETKRKDIICLSDLSPIERGIYLWQGDITALSVDGIVNAANSALLGCFVPCHGCIDNAIHSAAGIQLRLDCERIMRHQGRDEEPGKAKITEAYNLPCRYVLHTVGPVLQEELKEEDCRLLASCYLSCLELAAAHGLKSIAFCCISTGEFHFPNEAAARIAVNIVRNYQQENQWNMEVIFNVFKDTDYEIYRKLLGRDQPVNKDIQRR